ncbi:hypothetical protein NEAUS03_1935 [Nematocida ausubeli]|nr:hypothetical protein NEAUS03_1935 [Nematocida ausubeli]
MQNETLAKIFMQTVLKKPVRRKIYEKRNVLLKQNNSEGLVSIKAFVCSFIIGFISTYFIVCWIKGNELPY